MLVPHVHVFRKLKGKMWPDARETENIKVYLISKLVTRASPSMLITEYFSAPMRLGKWMLEPSDKVTTNSAGVNSIMICTVGETETKEGRKSRQRCYQSYFLTPQHYIDTNTSKYFIWWTTTPVDLTLTLWLNECSNDLSSYQRYSDTHWPAEITKRKAEAWLRLPYSRHTKLKYPITHRNLHLELLSLMERKASLTVLLTPVASLVRVVDHCIFVSMGIKTGVDVHCNLLVIWSNIHCKTWHKDIY